MNFARNDTSVIARWWWTVDRWMLGALALLIGYGLVLIMAASPAVAERIGLGTFYFVEHHLMILVPALALMLGISLLTPREIRRLALVGLVIVLASLCAGLISISILRWLPPEYTATMVVGPTARNGSAAAGPRVPLQPATATASVTEFGNGDEALSDFSRFLELLGSEPVAATLLARNDPLEAAARDLKALVVTLGGKPHATLRVAIAAGATPAAISDCF